MHKSHSLSGDLTYAQITQFVRGSDVCTNHSLSGDLTYVQITQFVRGTDVCTNHTVCQGI